MSHATRLDRLVRTSLGALVVLLTLSVPSWATASTRQKVSYQAAATLTGPVTAGQISEPLTALPTNLAASNYVEQEFFAAGTAMAFKPVSMPSNGRWTITPTTTAAYKTRIIVRRPASPAKFNGTVIVEWMNESAGESAPDWDLLNPDIVDAGDAWDGVPAQPLGVNARKPLLPVGKSPGSVQGLTQHEPKRYGSLHQPG